MSGETVSNTASCDEPGRNTASNSKRVLVMSSLRTMSSSSEPGG